MSAIVLVRHGQASFGTANYDKLSERGIEQSRRTGQALAARGLSPARVVAGTMVRHRETAEHALAGAGWRADVALDADWNEFDHLMAVQAVVAAPSTDPRTFQEEFEVALARWTSGRYDEEYPESFGGFGARVERALARLADGLGRGEAAVAFTSGGPIAWLAATLIGGGAAQWARLNRVAVNASLSTVVSGRSGLSLISYNEHGHLEPGGVTYR